MEATAFMPIGFGLITIGAGLGIGKLAAAAAEGIARQPEASDKISEERLNLYLRDFKSAFKEIENKRWQTALKLSKKARDKTVFELSLIHI